MRSIKRKKAATGSAQERNCAGDSSETRIRRVRARIERERETDRQTDRVR